MPKTTKKKTGKTAPAKVNVKVKKAPLSGAKKLAVKAMPKTATPKAVKMAESKVQKTAPVKAAKPQKNYFYANGKRKTSVASVRLITDGKGAISVNNRSFENYFPVATDQDKILSPLRLTNTVKLFDISVRVAGGGIHSQAEAVRHGISKALLLFNGELRSTLKHMGFLTRDSRVKERKKYGLKRARRAPQWQKR